jgi:hypothetical protein
MRRSALFWGTLLIFGGGLLLLDNLGVITVDVWGILWPTLLIAWGLSLLVRSTSHKPSRTNRAHVPLEGARHARLVLEHGAGRLEVNGGAEPGTLMDGVFSGGVNLDTHRAGDLVEARLSADRMGMPFGLDPHGYHWTLALNEQTPLNLEVKGGANEVRLNLSDLLVTDLRLSSGASSTEVWLPRQAGLTQVSVGTGVSSVEMRVPESAAARIRIESGLASIDINQARFPHHGGVYESPDFATAENKIEIRVSTGVASIKIY